MVAWQPHLRDDDRTRTSSLFLSISRYLSICLPIHISLRGIRGLACLMRGLQPPFYNPAQPDVQSMYRRILHGEFSFPSYISPTARSIMQAVLLFLSLSIYFIALLLPVVVLTGAAAADGGSEGAAGLQRRRERDQSAPVLRGHRLGSPPGQGSHSALHPQSRTRLSLSLSQSLSMFCLPSSLYVVVLIGGGSTAKRTTRTLTRRSPASDPWTTTLRGPCRPRTRPSSASSTTWTRPRPSRSRPLLSMSFACNRVGEVVSMSLCSVQ